MVRALGYSLDDFDPNDPGRLCRGRERWIDPLPTEGMSPFDGPNRPEVAPAPAVLHRLVVSGAAFSDETASDAQRGLKFSGVSAGEIISALFPGRTVLAVAEDAHPLSIPPEATEVEHYALTRSQGPLHSWRARWRLACPDAPTVEVALEAGADVLLILGPRPTRAAKGAPEPSLEGLDELIFFLVGFRMDGAPSRRFQPSALVPLLERAAAVVLVHQDKHAYSLGIYTVDRLTPKEPLERLVRARGSLPVPFAIPPMLARWDRAVWELRQTWDDRSSGEFPVPPAPEGRGGRRGRAHAEE